MFMCTYIVCVGSFQSSPIYPFSLSLGALLKIFELLGSSHLYIISTLFFHTVAIFQLQCFAV